MTRNQKIQAINAMINGNPQAMQQAAAAQGRPYTEQDREQQQKALSQLFDRPVSIDEARTMFGDFDKTSVTGSACYVLPNGMKLFF